MAESIVGQSIEKPIPPTDVPGASQVSKEVVAQDVSTSAPSDSISTSQAAPQQDIPQGYEDINQVPHEDIPSGYQELDPQLESPLPEYADGVSVDSPINQSPLDLRQRLALAAGGNKLDKLKYLKSNFEDAKLDKKGNFLVKRDGSWFKTDPTGLGDGDAWERTKELVGDTADRFFNGMQVAALTAKGGAASAGLGFIAGAAGSELIDTLVENLPETDAKIKTYLTSAGFGAASAALIPVLKQLKQNPALMKSGLRAAGTGAAIEAARTSWGRFEGTYNATPEEQLKDIANESLLSFGGEVIPPGIKPTMDHVFTAFARMGAKAGNLTKELISGFAEKAGGPLKSQVRRALDNPEVIKIADKAIKEAGNVSSEDVIGTLARKQNQELIKTAQESRQALTKQYGTMAKDLVDNTPESFSFKPREVMEDVMISLKDSNLGKIVKKSADGPLNFEIFSDKELSRILAAPESSLPEILGVETRKKLSEVGHILNSYANLPVVKGKMGAAKALELRRALSESFDDILSSKDLPGKMVPIITDVKNKAFEGIGNNFSKGAGVPGKELSTKYNKLNNEYARFASQVNMLTKAANSENPQELENVVKKLASKAGAFRQLKDEAATLAELIGHDRIQNIVDMEAAKGFVNFLPRSNTPVLLGSVASSLTGNPGIVGGAAATQLAASPRVLAKEIKYGSKLLDFAKKSAQKGVVLASDQDTLTALFRTVGEAASSEESDADSLLAQYGIK